MIKVAIGDIETNGLINQPSIENQQWALDYRASLGIKGKKKKIMTNSTKVHCAVLNVLDHGWFLLVPDEFIDDVKSDKRFKDVGKVLSIKQLPDLLDKIDQLVGHNFAKFDVPALELLMDYSYKGEVTDTYSMSKTLWADRDKDGNGWTGHGLAAWGEYFGIPKPEYEQWEEFDLDMLWRCYQDVIINTKTYSHLQQEAKGWDWKPALDLENNISMHIGKQETIGMPFDIDQAKLYIDQWSDRINEIYKILRPQLCMEMEDAVGNSKLDIWEVKHPTDIAG